MRGLLVLFALGMAVLAIPYKFSHDIKVNVFDVFKSLYVAAPLSAYLDRLKEGDFKFREDFFHFYPEQEIHEVLVVYKPKGEHSLHGYYVKTEDVSKYDDKFFDTVRPIYEYLNSGEYYAFTPYAAKHIVPDYFNAPLKKMVYEHYGDIDIHREIPLVFLVPKSEVDKTVLEDLILIAEYEVSRDGVHDIHEYFENIGKTLKRRDVVYTSPYYRIAAGLPYTYDPHYYLRTTYPYHILKKREALLR